MKDKQELARQTRGMSNPGRSYRGKREWGNFRKKFGLAGEEGAGEKVTGLVWTEPKIQGSGAWTASCRLSGALKGL